MKADPFARLEPDHPYPGALALGQELSADAGVVVGRSRSNSAAMAGGQAEMSA